MTNDAAMQPAAPGTYGEPPQGGYRLPASTRLGPVHLQVAELARSLAFYEGVLGFRAHRQDATRASLGAQSNGAPADGAPAGGAPADSASTIVELHARPGARPMTARGRLGLFHVAYLLPDRAALGRFARHLATLGIRPGAGDHFVSEALYLTDPDGLGIEVYADRPRETWQRVGRELRIGTEAVDMPALLRAGGDAPWTGMPEGTTVGHVHLHVGDLARGAAFYGDGLGFDRMTWRYPGALFLAAGGYHHHLGTNTWAGTGARPPEDGDARLLEWTVALTGPADVTAAAASLARAGAAVETDHDATGRPSVAARDPWGTRVRLQAVADASHSQS